MRWGTYLVVHHPGNHDVIDACDRDRNMLHDHTTFASTTLDQLLDAGHLPPATVAAVRNRYRPRAPQPRQVRNLV